MTSETNITVQMALELDAKGWRNLTAEEDLALTYRKDHVRDGYLNRDDLSMKLRDVVAELPSDY